MPGSHAVFPQIPRVVTAGGAVAIERAIASANFGSELGVLAGPFVVGTPTPLAVAYIQGPSSQFSMPAPGVLQYDGAEDRIVQVNGYASIASTGTETEVGIAISVNGGYLPETQARQILDIDGNPYAWATTVTVDLIQGNTIELVFIDYESGNQVTVYGAGLSIG